MAFPIQRLRRLRQHEAFRRMVRETRLAPSDFIYPLFVVEGRDRREEITSMPGICCRASGVEDTVTITVALRPQRAAHRAL